MVTPGRAVRFALAVAGVTLATVAARAEDLLTGKPEEPAAKPASAAPAERSAHPHPSTHEARLHHAAVAVAPAHEALLLRASIDHPELVKRAVVAYRTPRRYEPREVVFRRSSKDYVATIPTEELEPGWIEYAIELEALDGTRSPILATRSDMQRVEVRDDLDDTRERALDARLGGKRSTFFTSAEYVDFGTSEAQAPDAAGTIHTVSVDDRYFRVETGYTYRPLRLVSEFSLRGGIVRGQSPVPLGAPGPGQSEADRFRVGLNYGAPTVRFRLHDLVHVEGEFLTSVTELGFSVGGGAAVLLGDPYGSKLTLGAEGIEVFGGRFYSRLDIVVTPSLKVAPVVEVTNMPHADHYGVRLLGEVDWTLGAGFGVAVRGGYQARLFTEGGPSAGLTLRYAF